MISISPTFALQAHTLLEGGQPIEAISLCEQGLERYPDYATAYAVLAKAYRLTGDIRAAVGSIERGLQRLPLDRALLRLQSQLQEIPAQEQPLSAAEAEQSTTAVHKPEQPEPETAQTQEQLDELLNTYTQSSETAQTQEQLDELLNTYTQSSGTAQTQEQLDELPSAHTQSSETAQTQEQLDELPSAHTQSSETAQTQQNDTQAQRSAPEATHPEQGVQTQGPRLIIAEPRAAHTEHSAARPSHLRVIESAGESTEMPSLIWRSRNVRLIPGLEFTPLRFESKKDKLYRRTYKIPDPPPFPEFAVQKKKAIRLQPEESKGPLTPLEELARRLEAARIPRVEEDDIHPAAPVPEPPARGERSAAMVSETIARIYEMQGATQEAIKAYEALARQKPEQAEMYLKKVRELKTKE